MTWYLWRLNKICLFFTICQRRHEEDSMRIYREFQNYFDFFNDFDLNDRTFDKTRFYDNNFFDIDIYI